MSTTRTGAPRPVLGALLIFVALGAAGPLEAEEPSPIAGTVKDSLGNLLSGVEVLFVEMPSRDSRPTAVARSGRDGRFKVADLLPGPYRIAALKQGYRTFVGQVNTVLQDSVELVLEPAVRLDDRRLPEDPSWALRAPRRGMLHEIGEGPAPAVAALDPIVRQGDDLSIELEQFFSMSASVAESRPDSTEVQPSRTRLTLASTLGERGDILLEGRRERLAGTTADGPLDTTARRQDAALSVGLSYDTGADAQLDVAAYFNQTDYELAADAVAVQPALQQQQQTWGYDATWSKQIDPTSRFALALKYLDASLDSPSAPADPRLVLPGTAPAIVTNRSVGAGGSYQSVVSERHDVQVALRAQLLRSPSSTFLTDRFGPGLDRASSWTIQAEAQDTWSVARPFSLVYGLGYKQALVERDTTLVVPRLGASVDAAGWFARAVMSYHTVNGAGASAVSADLVPFRPERRLGYEAEIEMSVARDIRLRGGTRYSPIQFDYFGYLHGSVDADEHPLYLTDGNTAVHEHRLALVEERGNSRTYLELSDGRADGTVAPLLPFGGPMPIRAGRELRYRNGRLGIVFPQKGTDVRVEYQRVRAAGGDERARATGALQESVEVRVRQDVPGRQVPGDWQLLLAVRMGTVRSNDIEAWSEDSSAAETVDALNRRVSAGVSVRF